jgi:hypothetical protein
LLDARRSTARERLSTINSEN